jgi:hypothetical protein
MLAMYNVLAANCSAVVVFPHHLGPSISTAPLPANLRINILSAIRSLYPSMSMLGYLVDLLMQR